MTWRGQSCTNDDGEGGGEGRGLGGPGAGWGGDAQGRGHSMYVRVSHTIAISCTMIWILLLASMHMRMHTTSSYCTYCTREDANASGGGTEARGWILINHDFHQKKYHDPKRSLALPLTTDSMFVC